ncbi:MAG TPA: hypothetical protein VHV77_11475 [Pirellulales bacterium]|nr:hypothetical protein [Pirellulales bacterium]
MLISDNARVVVEETSLEIRGLARVTVSKDAVKTHNTNVGAFIVLCDFLKLAKVAVS